MPAGRALELPGRGTTSIREVAGPLHAMSVGARVIIETKDQPIPCEVVGFSGGNALLMPFAPLEGVRRGCRAVVSAVLWQILLAVGALLVAHQVRHAQSLYGTFGVVLGLLFWLQLQAQITLYAMEADVVRTRRLWPRSVSPPPLTGADRKAYTEYVEAERRLPPEEQEVAVRFPQEAHGDRA